MELPDLDTEGPESQDWHDDFDLDATTADNINTLDDLRRHNPILWALTRGLTTSRSIAGWICRPHTSVLTELRLYKARGWVYDSEGRRSVEWRFTNHEDMLPLLSLRRWLMTQRVHGGLFNPHEGDN